MKELIQNRGRMCIGLPGIADNGNAVDVERGYRLTAEGCRFTSGMISDSVDAGNVLEWR
jgi:hypothetical protein